MYETCANHFQKIRITQIYLNDQRMRVCTTQWDFVITKELYAKYVYGEPKTRLTNLTAIRTKPI